MLQTDYDTEFPPAVDGVGRAAITHGADVAAYRTILAQHPLVTDHAPAGLWSALQQVVRFTRYVAGYAIMSAGEAADRIGVVLVGRCRVWDPADPARTVGWVERGELLGEMSAMSGERRAATVGAWRDTVLAEIDIQALDALDDPRMALVVHRWIARVVARRAQGHPARRPAGMNLVVAGHTAALGQTFAEWLTAAGDAAGERWVLCTRRDFPETPTEHALEAVERTADFVVYVADPADRVWTRRLLRQADRVLVVADAESDPKLTRVDLETRSARAPQVLVLVQPAGIEHARDTARWLRDRTPSMHLHVRRGDPDDVARCMRLVTNRGRGVALAGASSRGIGYAGMLHAFEELGLTPDIVTGNSSGAMGAACLALGFDSGRTQTAYRVGFHEMRPSRRNLTLPIVSLLTGHRISRFLRRTFGEVQLEDLIVPCVLNAVDLSSLTLVELRTGPVWRAVRASISLPAYYPPVVVDHRVLVDGGVLQNLPVDPLAGCCRDGFVVLGDLSQDPEGFTGIEPYGTALSGWRLLLRRLWPFGPRRRYPVMPEVLFRTACLASLRNQQDLLAQPDPSWLHVRPDTPPIGLFEATDEQLPKLIEDTRRCTLDRLAASDRPAVHAALTMADRGARPPQLTAPTPAPAG